MKRKFCILFFVLSVMLVSGCGDVQEALQDDYTHTDEHDASSNVEIDNQEVQNMDYSAEYHSAEKTMTFLLDAIERKDSQAIKNQFSTYAKENIDDLDAKIERLIEEFPGCNDYTVKDTCRRKSDHGKITYILTPSFDFTMDGKEYRMRIIYYEQSDKDESKLGWYSIQLYQRHDPNNSSSMYTHGVDDDPDILLWDYTKDQ